MKKEKKQSWWKRFNTPYVWHRKEYRKINKIAMWTTIGICLIILIPSLFISTIVSNETGQSILIFAGILVGMGIGTGFTTTSIDQHEKKLAQKKKGE